MAKVHNPGRVSVTLHTRHVVPAGGSIDVTNDTLRECMMHGLSGLVAIGDLSVEWDPEDDEDEQPAPTAKARKPTKADA